MGRKQRRTKTTTPTDSASSGLVASVSNRFRFFRWMCAFFFVAALFIRLDVITVWPGAEGWSLDFAMSLERGSYLPAFIHYALLPLGAGLFPSADLFFLFPRLLSAAFLLGAAALYYRWGSRLFGRQVAELQLLVAAGSLWLPFFGKMATADSWALFGHVGIWLSTLLLLRSSAKKYQFIQGAFVAFSALAAPLSTVIFLVVLYLLLYRPSGYNQIWSRGWGALLVGGALLLLQGTHGQLTYWNLGQNTTAYGTFFLYAVLGLLPCIGFLFAGFRDLFFKLKQGEGLAFSLLSIALAAFVSQSILFPFALACIAGKQMQLYFSRNYPWENWVKGAAILHLIFALIGSFLALIGGLLELGGEGYRAVLGMIAAYWIFSLLAVLGLYGRRRDFTIGGSILTGLLSVMFFWVQVYPYLELQRNWPLDFIEAMSSQKSSSLEHSIYVPKQAELSNALPYLRRAAWTFADSTSAAYQLSSWPNDTVSLNAPEEKTGRTFLELYKFRLSPLHSSDDTAE